jgi:selT/selW/selH-like putative selenoprotein
MLALALASAGVYREIIGKPMKPLFFLAFPSFLIGSAFRQSGAFEVDVDNELMYSKIKTGRMPHPQELTYLVGLRFSEE